MGIIVMIQNGLQKISFNKYLSTKICLAFMDNTQKIFNAHKRGKKPCIDDAFIITKNKHQQSHFVVDNRDLKSFCKSLEEKHGKEVVNLAIIQLKSETFL